MLRINSDKPSQSIDNTELSHTLYLLVIVNKFDTGCVDTHTSEDDPLASLNNFDPEPIGCYSLDQLGDVWSGSADTIRSILIEAGFRTVIVVVATNKKPQYAFQVIGQVEDIVDRKNVVRFRGILAGLFDGTVRRYPPLKLNKHPGQIQTDFETALATKLVPNSLLIVLNQPRSLDRSVTDQQVSVSFFNESALMKMRVLNGFLIPGTSFEDTFREALKRHSPMK